jgi:hypothetical protein
MMEKRQSLQQMMLGKIDIHILTATRFLPLTMCHYQLKEDQIPEYKG